jgi:HK97 family phage prohead protease
MPELKVKVAAPTEIKANAERRSIDACFSSEAIDSYGDRVDQSSWDLERYKANPVLLLQHNAFGGFLGGVRAPDVLPIGHVENIRVENKRLVGTAVFASAAANPLAEQVFQLYREGAMSAFSVGFVPHSYHEEKINGKAITVLEDCELMEISCVAVPANADATCAARVKSVLGALLAPRAPGENASDRLFRLAGGTLPRTHTPPLPMVPPAPAPTESASARLVRFALADERPSSPSLSTASARLAALASRSTEGPDAA